MKFYINTDEVFVEILPQLVKAQDTTNDSFSCVLAANTRELPYDPMTPFKIVYDDDTEQTMWIISDNVSVFSTNPLAYKHSLSIVQYRYFLNKHLVRNTVFTQPREKNVKIYGSVSCALYETGSGSSYAVNYRSIPRDSSLNPNYWTDTLKLNSHTRVKNAHFRLKLWGIQNYNTGVDSLKELTSISSSTPNNTNIRSTARFRLVDENNSNYSIISFSIDDSYTNDIILDDAQVELINDYIENNDNISLKLSYESGYTGTPTEIASAFATTVQKNVTDGFDPIEDMTYAYLTIQIEVNFELYNSTMYDVLETLLKQYQLQDDTYGSKRDLLFNLPTNNDLATLLKTTYAPDNLVFTQATYYEALETIFRFYDAGFKFDENKTLEIEYYNDLNRQISPSLSGRTMAFSDKDYNSGRVSFYQNALIEQKIKSIHTRANTLGVPAKSDYGIIVYKPIYSIEKLELKVDGSFTVNTFGIGGGYINGTANNLPLDLTHFIVNKDIWSVLNKAGSFGTTVNTDLYQINTIPYDRGSTFICVSDYYSNFLSQTKTILGNVKLYAFYRFFGVGYVYGTQNWSSFATPSATDYTSQVFNIEYLADQNGKVETQTILPQYNGQAIANQSSGLIDLNKLGHAMFTESLKNGVPILNVNIKIDSWDNRIKEGDYIIYNNEYWVANIVEYVALGDDKYRFSVQFTKNFNLLSLRIRSDSEKRLTAISGDLAMMSEDNYIDYVYVSDTNESSFMTTEDIVMNKNVLASMLAQTFKLDGSAYTIKQIDLAGISTYDMDGNINITNSIAAEDIFIPIVKYGAGNCICFEMQYNHPVSAGNLLTKTTGWFGSNAYFSQALPYTDDEGWADKITIEIYNVSQYGEENGIGNIPQLIPSITIGANTYNLLERAGKLTGLKYFKKPNEIFGLNYEWCFLPVPRQLTSVFIGNKFINDNFFTKPEIIKGKTYYLYFVEDNSYKYSILDTKGYSGSTITEITDVYVEVMSNNSVEVRFGVSNDYAGRTATAWAICDENGDIYFASNNSKAISGSAMYSNMKITFNTRKSRI